MSNAPCLHKDLKSGRKCWASVYKNGYCEKHQPEKWYNPAYETPKNWNSLKNFVIARDRGICYVCGETGADSVDHVIPKSEGGTDLTNNLKAIHDKVAPHCHREKTQREAQHGRASRNKMKPYGQGRRR